MPPGQLTLTREAYDDFMAHAGEGYPHEVVGILAASAGGTPQGKVVHIVRLQNERADRAKDRYYVGPLVLFRAEQELEALGYEVVGYYHSHPDHPADYSETDREQALPNRIYVIVSVTGGVPSAVKAFQLVEDRSAMIEQPLAIEDPS